MSPNVLRRAQAEHDIEIAAEHYFEQGGAPLELRFIDALEAAINEIANEPRVGSDWIGRQLGKLGLRTRALKKFPYYLFYVQSSENIELWRVLHRRRDLPAPFQDR